MSKRFNVRVYGLLVHDHKLLVSKEVFNNKHLIKLPGGGVQPGEGIIDALKREFVEELETKITSYELFHITEHFIQSAFETEEQIIAIYYLIKTNQTNFSFSEHQVAWESINSENLEDIGFTFPQDLQAVKKLSKSLSLT